MPPAALKVAGWPMPTVCVPGVHTSSGVIDGGTVTRQLALRPADVTTTT